MHIFIPNVLLCIIIVFFCVIWMEKNHITAQSFQSAGIVANDCSG